MPLAALHCAALYCTVLDICRKAISAFSLVSLSSGRRSAYTGWDIRDSIYFIAHVMNVPTYIFVLFCSSSEESEDEDSPDSQESPKVWTNHSPGYSHYPTTNIINSYPIKLDYNYMHYMTH